MRGLLAFVFFWTLKHLVLTYERNDSNKLIYYIILYILHKLIFTRPDPGQNLRERVQNFQGEETSQSFWNSPPQAKIFEKRATLGINCFILLLNWSYFDFTMGCKILQRRCTVFRGCKLLSAMPAGYSMLHWANVCWSLASRALQYS